MKTIKFKRWSVVTILLLLLSATSFAQEKEIDFDELLDMDLERLIEIQSAGRGDVGSFGYRLGTTESSVQIHGYATNEFISQQNSVNTFDNHYFNVLVGANIQERIFGEIMLEYEHGGDEIQIRYAQVDYKISDALIFRTGKFLVPINTFNEYLYPEYINSAISRPFQNRNITPTAWAEVGIQLRGRFDLSSSTKGFYSVFMVNGLEGSEGGDIRGMRNNFRDKNDDNKAVGARFGITNGGFELGAGVYNGAYTADGQHNLTIMAFDAGYVKDNLTLRAEMNMAAMQTSAEDINRNGLSFTAAYILAEKWQPVARYDFMNWDDPLDATKDKSRIYLGMNYLIASTMNIKAGYEIITNDGTDVDDNVFAIQLALGF
jgi:hypothetical protein